MKFEYLTVMFNLTDEATNKNINELGLQEWELVSSFPTPNNNGRTAIYIFKKEIKQKELLTETKGAING